jgi:hypothetical protein
MSVSTTKHILNLIKKDVIDSNNYYLVAGGLTPWVDEGSPPPVVYSTNQINKTYREMLYGKRIDDLDIAFLIKRVTWVTGIVYAEYNADNTDTDNFFIINGLNSVYKCIKNAGGTPSTIEPTSMTSNFIQTSDGYVWKYMFTVSANDLLKFGSLSFIPVTANNAVISAAVPGTIDNIAVTNGGNNFITNSGRILQVMSNTTFRIDETASPATNIYKNSSLFILSGGGAGTLRYISESSSNSSGVYISLTSPAPGILVNSNYVISPKVIATGDGSGVTAYSNVAANGTITDITVLTPGTNYTYLNVSVTTANNYGSSNVSFSSTISPKNGHGSDPALELKSSQLGVYGAFGDGGYKFPDTDLTYRQFSLLYQPNTSSSSSDISYGTFLTTTATFTVGETVIGSNTSANGIVLSSNSTYLSLYYASGNFANGETIVGQTSGISSVITNPLNKDTIRNSGDLLYYFNSTPINRVDNKSEKIRFIINLEDTV